MIRLDVSIAGRALAAAMSRGWRKPSAELSEDACGSADTLARYGWSRSRRTTESLPRVSETVSATRENAFSAAVAAGAAGLLAAVILASPVSAMEVGPLRGKAIEQVIKDRRIYLKAPLGGEFPLYYQGNGVVDGSGEAVGLGRFMAPTDRGRWWVADDRLCQQWEEWYDGQRHCFILERTGETTLYWKRDDGLEGEARIGR
jgi:hypothetical protein